MIAPDQRSQPWTPAERRALDDIDASRQAEEERRLQRAIQEQQQRLQQTGEIQ